MIIRTEHLHKRYNGTTALRDVCLEIATGGIVGLLGPNGAGKTTLVEIIEGLRMPTTGAVQVLGLDPAKSPQQLRERIGVQLQETPLLQDLTVAETLRLFASFFRQPQSTEHVLGWIELSEKAKTRIRHLSAGQRQRLAIGLALINNPELVLLDEPTTGLDPMARRGIHEIIRTMKQQGKTVILTTHYIEEAEALCDRILIIKQGEIVADGAPFDLVVQSGGSSTLWIAVSGEFDPGPIISAGAHAKGKDGAYFKFEIEKPAGAIIALGETLRRQNVTLEDLRLKRPSLEDVYLEKIGEPAAPKARIAGGESANQSNDCSEVRQRREKN